MNFSLPRFGDSSLPVVCDMILSSDWHGRGINEYIPFPEALKGRYQSFIEANLSALREGGDGEEFMCVEAGIRAYLDALYSRRS